MKKLTVLSGISVVIVVFMLIGFALGVTTNRTWHLFPEMDIHDKRTMLMEEQGIMIFELLEKGDYACCLERPCMYCLKKKEGCDCLEEVLNGEHPCGECIGEILEGNGNRFLAEHFANAISEEVGEQHKAVLQQIISEKYRITIDEQV
jgi:hypothetical protein